MQMRPMTIVIPCIFFDISHFDFMEAHVASFEFLWQIRHHPELYSFIVLLQNVLNRKKVNLKGGRNFTR